MNSKAKGSSFERLIAKRLSLWWTQDVSPPREDVFWRTSNSGGRSTIRSKVGKKTSNSAGDIGATDECGLPLLRFMTLELKKGYNKFSVADLLDKPTKGAKPLYESWFDQAEASSVQAGSLYWSLIVNRDRRETVIFFPEELAAELLVRGAAFPYGKNASLSVRTSQDRWIDGFLLQEFLDGTDPSIIKSWDDGKK